MSTVEEARQFFRRINEQHDRRCLYCGESLPPTAIFPYCKAECVRAMRAAGWIEQDSLTTTEKYRARKP